MEKLNFKPFPRLTTERLILRQLEETDDQQIFMLRTDNRVNRYLNRSSPNSIEEARKFISKINDGIKQNKSIYWVITLNDSPKLIGTICLWNFLKDKKIAEVGYELNPSFQKQGIMNETLKKIIEFGFQTIGFNRIDAYTNKENINSTNLLLKNNFKQDTERKDKENTNNMVFTLTRQNWK